MKSKIRLDFKKSGFSDTEWRTLKKLSSPNKIQDFLNKLPFNFESSGENYVTVSRILKAKKAHCFEGALLAAAALWVAGEQPLLLDLKTTKPDLDHVVTLFQREGKWGAISKTNHAVLRYREPVYRDARELAMSYFHEYFLNNGVKTLRSISKPFDLSKFSTRWLAGDGDLFEIVKKLDFSPHTQIISKSGIRKLRKADLVEIRAGEITEYP